MCDEAQFYTPAQVEQLAGVVDELNADVHAFGLLTDFRGRLFEGSARFLELADERQELQVEARCWCGARATQNARLVNGQQVYDGEVVVVGDTGGDAEVVYELLCRRHWLRGETGRVDEAAAAELVDDATAHRLTAPLLHAPRGAVVDEQVEERRGGERLGTEHAGAATTRRWRAARGRSPG